MAGVSSVDPNDIIGPAGFGAQKFISASGVKTYTIDFQNTATATAPAQTITITQQLDANLDWRSFRLTGFGFGSETTTLAGNQAFYSALLDYSATKGFDVQVTAGVNVETGLVTWTFQTIDPATGQAPTDPQLGLLPPDDAQGDGEGFVSYTVAPKAGLATGDTVSAQAIVIFDTNAPISTPAISNEVDATAPVSSVSALPATEASGDFTVSWSGTDDAAGSGIANYTIYVSDNGAAPTVWLQNTTRTSAIFNGAPFHHYAFFATATDNAGNVELMHASADAVTDVLCYLPGTRILTAAGERCVEDLQRGELVVTRFGGLRPVRWIGRQKFAAAFVAPARRPVRIAAGALGPGLPAAPLGVSPGHSLLLGEVLVLAKNLVNGITITQGADGETIGYYGIDLGVHDCVLANGTWSESFADGPGLRAQFHNLDEFLALNPGYVPPEALALCAPRPEAGPALEAALAGVLPVHEPGPLRGFIDIPGPDRVEGWACDEAAPDLPVALEILAGGERLGIALACHYRADLAAAGFGRGHCMFSFVLPAGCRAPVTVRRLADGASLTPTCAAAA